jgi:poly(3-hydroxyalkanoate) depolymerase
MTSERHVTAAGRRLNVNVRPGDGSLPPLLLLNGIGAPLQLLEPFVAALNPRREVIRLDVPGVGGSPAPLVPYSMGTLSLTVSGILDQLGHRNVDVMGFSWGGALAQHLALQHRRRVRRLVLGATATGALSVPGGPRALRHMITPRRHREPSHASLVAADIYGGSMRTTPELARELLDPGTSRRTNRGYYYQLGAAAGWSSLAWLPFVRQRTLIIAGDDDPLIPTINPKVMARLIPRSELHLYEGGHLALLTDAAVLAPVIERFLDAPRKR